MKIIVKQLKQGNDNISPITIADSVLVKLNNTVITLTEALKRKQTIITPKNSGLKLENTNNGTSISHITIITPSKNLEHVKIKYDGNGHIVDTLKIGKKSIYVQNLEQLNSESDQDESLSFGDDFNIDINKIIHLTWQTT